MNKFEIGKTYSTRSIGDSNCIIRATVLKRTAATVTVQVEGEKAPQVFRVKANYRSTAECFKPWGSFSMAPTLSADDTAALLPDWAKSQNPVVIAQHAAALVLLQGGRA